MRYLLSLLCIIALTALARPSQEPAKDAIKSIKLLPDQSDAGALCLADLNQLSVIDPLAPEHTRYLWIQSAAHEDMQAGSKTINETDRCDVILRPPPLGKDRLMVLRVDLRLYWPKIADLKDVTQVWEDFQFDPKFSVFITGGSLKFFQQILPDWRGKAFVVRWRQEEGPYVGDDGKSYVGKHWKRDGKVENIVLAELKDVELVRLPGMTTPQIHEELVSLTGSQAPMVSLEYFMLRALTSIQDKGLYATIYGGRYRQLIGAKKSTIKGASDEDVLFEQLGVGNVAQGVRAKDVYGKLRGDKRSGLFRSGVTASPRQIEVFRTLSGSVEWSTGLISVTHDLKRQNIDIDAHPLANLLKFQDDGREVIYERPNGTHGYDIFNGQGAQLDEVPFDVAKDGTEPAPQHGRLQLGVSCIACHSASGEDGWKPFKNDVKALLDYRKGGALDIVGDLKGSLKLFDPDTVSRLLGLYGGDPERAFIRARDDHASAILRACGPWKTSKTQADIVKLASQHQVKLIRDHAYNMVDAAQALKECGVECDPALLPRLLALPAGAPEDVRIGAMIAGIPTGRYDFDLVYSMVAERVRKGALEMVKVSGGAK